MSSIYVTLLVVLFIIRDEGRSKKLSGILTFFGESCLYTTLEQSMSFLLFFEQITMDFIDDFLQFFGMGVNKSP